MFERVVIGVDRETRGRDAIALARQLVAPGGQLVAAHVHSGYPIPAMGPDYERETGEREAAERLLSEVIEEAGLDATARCTGSPSIGRGLHRLAEASRADLLVLGSTTHRSLLGRICLGDQTRDALNGAPCAVAVAPAAYASQTHPMREIGVAFDGSEESRRAVAVARAMATRFGAELSACEAVSLPISSGAGPWMGPWVIDPESIDDWLDRARRHIEALGGVTPHVAYGEPVEELSLYSASVDLLVVGSRGYGPLGTLVHGSTSRQLLGRARSPLVILPRAGVVDGEQPAGASVEEGASVAARAGAGASVEAGSGAAVEEGASVEDGAVTG